jgi:hypothetical protein
LGGLMWFAVPFTLATTLGLTGLALDLPLSAKEVSSELVLPKPLFICGAIATQQLPRNGPASNNLHAEQQRFAAAAEMHKPNCNAHWKEHSIHFWNF